MGPGMAEGNLDLGSLTEGMAGFGAKIKKCFVSSSEEQVLLDKRLQYGTPKQKKRAEARAREIARVRAANKKRLENLRAAHEKAGLAPPRRTRGGGNWEY
jgi:hypothetical protein